MSVVMTPAARLLAAQQAVVALQVALDAATRDVLAAVQTRDDDTINDGLVTAWQDLKDRITPDVERVRALVRVPRNLPLTAQGQ